MHPWSLKSRKIAFQQLPWITVELHEIELPSGQTIPEWAWVVTPDFVNVIVVRPDGRVVCFRQDKYAIEGLSMAPVGGYIEPGESPDEAAKREMLEETGYAADEWHFMGKYAADGNRGAGHGYLYLALEAQRVAEIQSDDLERIELHELTMEEFENAVLSGEFKLLPWAANAALSILHLRRIRPGWFD
jgi:ADP-ribose pyrophosphatase